MLIETNEVKALIVNLESELSATKEWSDVSYKMKCVFLYNDDIQLSNWKMHVNPSSGFVKKENKFSANREIKYALNHLMLPSSNVAYIVLNVLELKDAAQQGLGTILVNNTQITKEHLGYLPDIILYNVSDIIDAIESKSGFFAEVLATKLSSNNNSSSRFVLTLLTRSANLIICGRYFGKGHPNSEIHQLSQRLLRSKNDATQNQIFVEILSYELGRINNNLGKIDGVTRVPARPESRDRLGEVITIACKATEFSNYNDCLVCVEDFPKQKDFSNLDERAFNVRGKFKVNMDVKGKHIILVDDVYTTGATLKECYSELIAKGALKITAVVFAVNQFPLVFTRKMPAECSKCGNDFKMRLRKDGTVMFFGCSSYPDCTHTVDFEEGWYKFNEKNQIKVDIQDFDITF